jgi:hypothetical protein
MLPPIMVDPSTIWLIDSNDTPENAETAISSAMEWMKPNVSGPLQLYLSRRGVEALAEANAFPAEPRLSDALKAVGLDGVLSAKTLAASVSRFLSSNSWIEEKVGISDVLLQATKISPDPTFAIANPQLRILSVEAFGLAALCANENDSHLLYAFPRQSGSHRDVRVEAGFDIIDLGENNIRTEETVDRQIMVLRDPSAWRAALSPEDIWRGADGPEELEVAISLAATALGVMTKCGLKEFRVGTSFLECLRSNGAAGSGAYALSVLQKCAQTVLIQSSLQPKPFYTSSDANATVRERKRDKAKAWRLHVTKSHQALRLMYWALPCGQIEFATLEEKSEESIHDGEYLPQRKW